ncbi:hypothetical protein CVD28_10550 [Bacillus sp. M6-12]|uniref:CGNR zinc finger domain-containing protein n=1 Tax=Bacillus sp. M6-12 TaxID=2054166 RepID=UPI000C7619DC|nr:CGNR zinc finger domain-containing protein [Bacillus sp. M6-12]PLS17663.1 hypothetical protein CVD28_10550 [Bacillus sp. M6-12]
MNSTRRDINQISFIGQNLSLDFCNTVGWHATDDPKEWLHNYETLVRWSILAKIIPVDNGEMLIQEALSKKEEAMDVYRNAIALREVIYRLYVSIINGTSAEQADMDRLNQYIGKAFSRLKLQKRGSAFELSFQESIELDSVLCPLVQSVSTLLTSLDLSKLKQCEGGGCGWLFLDTSKNRSRRWCSMDDCGNRAKARRHYKKIR